MRTIPMGTAYAVWTDPGVISTFILGVLVFSERATVMRFFFFGLVVIGILGHKLSSSH